VTLRAYHASPPGRQGGPGREQLAGLAVRASAGAPRPAPGPRSTRAPSAGASPRQPQARAGSCGGRRARRPRRRRPQRISPRTRRGEGMPPRRPPQVRARPRLAAGRCS